MDKRWRRYFKNIELTVKGFQLSITSNGTVYHLRTDGMRKLDTLWHGNAGIMTVSLPDETEARIEFSKDGIRILQDKQEATNV